MMKKTQQGFSLVELMIALVLGLVVIGGVIQVFSSSNQAYRSQQAVSRIQESGRFALEFIKPSIRDAAKLHFCVNDSPPRNHLRPAGADFDDTLFDTTMLIQAWDFAGTGINDNYTMPTSLVAGAASAANFSSTTDDLGLPEFLRARAIPGSDVLLLKGVEAIEGLTSCGNNTLTSASISINYGNNAATCPAGVTPPDQATMERLLPQGGLVLVTNCTTGGDLFQRTNNATASSFSKGGGGGGAQPGNLNPFDWSTRYDAGMQAFAIRSMAYYIGQGASGEPALFMVDFSNGGEDAQPLELVEGVESMQVTFTEVTDANGTTQISEPDQVAPTATIIGINLGLLVRSTDNADLDIDTRTFALAGANIDPQDDFRMRQIFTSAVAVRNNGVVF